MRRARIHVFGGDGLRAFGSTRITTQEQRVQITNIINSSLDIWMNGDWHGRRRHRHRHASFRRRQMFLVARS